MAYQLTDEDKRLAQEIGMRQFQETQPAQPAKKTSGGLGSFLLGLLPGGSLLDKGLRGEEISGGDVATEVGLSLVPFGLGKLAKGAKGILGGTKGAAKTVASDLPPKKLNAFNRLSPSRNTDDMPEGATILGQQDEPSKFSLGGKLKSMGDRALLNQYGTISSPVSRSTNPTQTVSELADIGITKPDDAERIASMFTGSEGLVNKAVLRATGNAGGVDTSKLRDVFEDAISNYGVVDKDADSLRKVFNAQSERLFGGRTGSLNPLANPDDTLAVMKAFEKRRANLLGKGDNYRLSTPERGDQASVLGLVTDELEDALYRGAGANKNLKDVLTPEFRSNLVSLNPGSVQWEKFVDDKVMGAKGVDELRSSMAPFVRVRKMIDDAETNAMTFGGRTGNAAQMLTSGGGFLGGIKDAVAGLASGPVSRVAGNTLRAAGQKLDGGGAVPGVGATATPTASRGMFSNIMSNPVTSFLLPQAGVRAGADLLGLRQGETAIAQEPQPGMGIPGGAGAEGMLGAPAGETESIYTREAAAQDIQNDLQTTGGANMEKYLKLYEFLNPEGGAGGKANANTQKALAQSANADSTLRQLEGALAQAGGAGGPVAGNIGSFFGGLGLNNDVKTYNDLVGGSTTQIAKALGETGAMSDADRAAYSKLLPKVTDTPQVAAAKFAALRERMAAAQQNTLQYGAGSGVEDALAAMAF